MTEKPARLNVQVQWGIDHDGDPVVVFPDGIPAATMLKADSVQSIADTIKQAAERAQLMAQVRKWLLKCGATDELVAEALKTLSEKQDISDLAGAFTGLGGGLGMFR